MEKFDASHPLDFGRSVEPHRSCGSFRRFLTGIGLDWRCSPSGSTAFRLIPGVGTFSVVAHYSEEASIETVTLGRSMVSVVVWVCFGVSDDD